MSANNTPVVTPVGESVEKVGDGFLSRIQEGIKGLPKTVRNLVGGLLAGATALTTPTAIVGGAATTAAVTENAEGATVLVNLQGLPNSTVSQPQKISGTASQTTNTTQYNSQLLYSTPQAGGNTTIDRITLNLNTADIGSGGSLTFTFRLRAGTDDSTATNNGKGIANTQYQVRQEARFGLAGGPSNTIGFLDSGIRTNDAFGGFINAEAWSVNSGIVSYTIPNFTQAGEYYLDNALFVQNSTGVARLGDMTVNFSPIPEPSTGLLAGAALTAALLHRRRKPEPTKNLD